MEDLPGNELRQHNACDCVICTPCLDRTIEHHQTTDTTLPKDHIKCPGCRQEAEPSTEFVTLDQIGEKNSKKKSFLCLFLKKGLPCTWFNEFLPKFSSSYQDLLVENQLLQQPISVSTYSYYDSTNWHGFDTLVDSNFLKRALQKNVL